MLPGRDQNADFAPTIVFYASVRGGVAAPCARVQRDGAKGLPEPVLSGSICMRRDQSFASSLLEQ